MSLTFLPTYIPFIVFLAIFSFLLLIGFFMRHKKAIYWGCSCLFCILLGFLITLFFGDMLTAAISPYLIKYFAPNLSPDLFKFILKPIISIAIYILTLILWSSTFAILIYFLIYKKIVKIADESILSSRKLIDQRLIGMIILPVALTPFNLQATSLTIAFSTGIHDINYPDTAKSNLNGFEASTFRFINTLSNFVSFWDEPVYIASILNGSSELLTSKATFKSFDYATNFWTNVQQPDSNKQVFVVKDTYMKLLLSSLDTVFYTFSNSITSQFNFSAISANNCINTVLNGNASRTGMYNALNYLANGLPASSIIGVNNILSMTKIPFQEVFSSDSFADALKEILDGSDFKFNFPQVSLSDFSTAMTFLKLASINSEGDGKTDKNVVKYWNQLEWDNFYNAKTDNVKKSIAKIYTGSDNVATFKTSMEDLASRNLLVSIYTDSIDGDNFNCDPLFEYSTNIDSTDYKYTFGTYPRSSTSVTDSNNFFLPIPILSSIATSPNIKPIDFLKSGCSSGSYDVICDAIDSYDAINGGVDTSDRIKQCITQFVSYFFTSFNEKGTNWTIYDI